MSPAADENDDEEEEEKAEEANGARALRVCANVRLPSMAIDLCIP